MIFYNDLAGENYARFIEYALKRSDAVMFMLDGYIAKPTEQDALSDQEYLQYMQTYDPMKKLEEIYWASGKSLEFLQKIKNMPNPETPEQFQARLIAQRADRKKSVKFFREHALAFYDQLRRFMIKERHNPIWPVTERGNCDRDEEGFNLGFFKSCEELKPYLLQPGHLFGWRYLYYPEDLAFFKDHYCWFGLCQHEEFSLVYPNSQVEYDLFIDMGMQIEEPFHPTPKEKLFYEDYPIGDQEDNNHL